MFSPVTEEAIKAGGDDGDSDWEDGYPAKEEEEEGEEGGPKHPVVFATEGN